MTPIIFTITGPCCSGKSTLEAALKGAGFNPAISTTTRTPRHGEVNGQAYYFVNQESFDTLSRNDELVEQVFFNGNSYGITVGEVNRLSAAGNPITVVCEPHGQRQIVRYGKSMGWKVVSVFVDVPTAKFAERYLSRYLSNYLSSPSEDLLSIYSNRLATLIETELKWNEDRHKYDFYVPSSDEGGLDVLVERLAEWARYISST